MCTNNPVMCFSELILPGHSRARPALVPGADHTGVASPGVPLALQPLAPGRSAQETREALP